MAKLLKVQQPSRWKQSILKGCTSNISYTWTFFNVSGKFMGGRGNRVVNTLLGHKRPREDIRHLRTNAKHHGNQSTRLCGWRLFVVRKESAPRGLAKGVTRPNISRGTMIKYGTNGHPLTPLHRLQPACTFP